MAEFQRTDCIHCGSRIYHAPIVGGPVIEGSSLDVPNFLGHRPQGQVFHHASSEHYILITPDGDFAVATCYPYWRLHEAFDTFERIVVGTRHRAATNDDDIPF